MDVIRDSIENRAEDVCKAQEELRAAPLYLHSAAYGSEHGETAQYRLSYQANLACKEAVEQAINSNYGTTVEYGSAVKDVLEKFGPERVQFILANTIRYKDRDGRISRDNKTWAKTVPMPEDSESRYLVVDKVNPGLTDLFTRKARKMIQEAEKGSFCKSSNRSRLPANLPPRKNGSRAMSSQKRKRDVPVLFWGFRCGDGCDPAENGPVRDKKPERLSSEDGAGRLCGAAGFSGAEGTGFSHALFQ